MEGYIKKLEMDVNSSMTVFDLKNTIMKNLFKTSTIKPENVTNNTPRAPIHSSKIIITKNSAKVPVPDFENGRTLGDLKFKTGDSINV